MKKFLYLLVPVILAVSCGPRDGSYTFYICSTNDVHGRYFDSLYVGTGISGSLLAVSSAVDSIRNAAGPENVILIDAGDCVQGDNASYYYNYVDTLSPHLYARMAAYMGYDAVVVGNHDIEAGHPVYDRLRKELPCPFLAANALKVRPDGSVSGRPYFQDYLIQTRNGIRIAIIGFTNPNIKNWLSPDLWSGMEFVSLIPYVQEYVDRVRKKEKPDIVIVAAHTGTGQGFDPEQIEAVRTSGTVTGEPLHENQGLALFQTLEGVDFVICAHDHSPAVFETDSVCLINSGSHCRNLGLGRIDLEVKNGKVAAKSCSASLVPVCKEKADTAMRSCFRKDYEAVKAFTVRPVGNLEVPFVTRDSYTGMCPYIDFIHTVSLGCAPARISFAAPLTYDGEIEPGTLIYNDLFKIYPYENQLFVVRMTGREIRNYLEYSYGQWINTVSGRDGEHLLKIRNRADARTGSSSWSFEGRAYNFDSAAGIVYSVDVTKPQGERISITSLASGEPFSEDSTYCVAMTSYRASGGGGLMREGAGIDTDRIDERVVARYPEIRNLIYDAVRNAGTLTESNTGDVSLLGSWKFVPERLAGPMLEKDMALVFGE